jgi:hypothetical protein
LEVSEMGLRETELRQCSAFCGVEEASVGDRNRGGFNVAWDNSDPDNDSGLS